MGSNLEKTSDSMLAGVSQGDHASWTKLVELYRPLIVRELRKILYQFNSNDADDIAQNVFLVLIHRISSFQSRGAGSFRAFLREISRRQALAWIHRRTVGQLPKDFEEAEARSRLHEWSDPWSELNLSFDAEHERYWKEKILEEVRLRCLVSEKLKRSYSVFLAVSRGEQAVKDVASDHRISSAAGYRALHAVQAIINQVRDEWADFL